MSSRSLVRIEADGRRLSCAVVALVVWLCAVASASGATSWRLALDVQNAASEVVQLTMGADPEATAGIDPILGEAPLPPPPPAAIFDARLYVSNGDASLLDLRSSSDSELTFLVGWQAGSGGSPITLTWNAAQLPRGEFILTDAAGGVFIGPIDMTAQSSVTVPANLWYVSGVEIVASIGEPANAPPIWEPIPSRCAYVGQRLEPVDLPTFVRDIDDAPSALTFKVMAWGAVTANIDANNTLTFRPPTAWAGADSVEIEVVDSSGAADTVTVLVRMKSPDADPTWNWDWLLTAGSNSQKQLRIGVQADASDGLDQGTGEVDLPPKPPIQNFDVRYVLPVDQAASYIDVRGPGHPSLVYVLEVQPGIDGWPVSLAWNQRDVPPGNWLVSVNSTQVPDIDPRIQANVVISEADIGLQSFQILISGVNLVDGNPPQNCKLTSVSPSAIGRVIQWNPAIDVNFDYYDLILLDAQGEVLGRHDRWSDPVLEASSTTFLDVEWPPGVDEVQLVCWDRFGNSSTDQAVATASPSNTPARPLDVRVVPNPFNPRTRFQVDVGEAVLVEVKIFDARGRLVRVLGKHASGPGRLNIDWNGQDEQGRFLASGTYLARVVAGTRSAAAKLALVR